MFEVPTVFVIGAGASARWDFSVGSALRGEIAGQLAVQFSQEGHQIGDSTEVIDAFLNKARRDKTKLSHLLGSMRSRLYAYDSIDEFIDAQQDDEQTELAKLAIAYIIGRQEGQAERAHFCIDSNPETFSQRVSKTWLGEIATRMASRVRVKGNPAALAENVGFIIFNYDRSLEHFLHQWISRLGIGPAEAARILNSTPIIHPYGTIGDLPWQVGTRRFEFGRIDNLGVASDSIRTFTEQIEDSIDLQRMRFLVENATNIVFLGFGFHKQNMELLAPKQLRSAKHVYATAYQAPDGEHRRISDSITGRFKLYGNPHIERVTCDEFASSYMRLIAS